MGVLRVQSLGVGQPVDASLTYRAVDATNKAGSLRFLNATQSWVNDANQLWAGNIVVPRYTKGVVRWPAPWTSRAISFNAQCTLATNSDMAFPVFVDGVLATYITSPADALTRRFDVGGLPIAGGGSTVEVWEPVNGRPVGGNSGADGPWEGGDITGVWLPPGMSLTKPTATTGIVAVGTSIVSCAVSAPGVLISPEVGVGPLGKLRLLAQAQGWLVGSRDVGATTQAGEGFTAAQLAADVVALSNQMGLATTWVWCGDVRNDWAYYGLAGVSNSPTVVGNFVQAFVNALPASYRVVICTPITQTSEAANSGGFTLPNYRTAVAAVTGPNVVAHVDGTTFGITNSDLGDGVHPNTLGIAKYVAGIRGAFGL